MPLPDVLSDKIKEEKDLKKDMKKTTVEQLFTWLHISIRCSAPMLQNFIKKGCQKLQPKNSSTNHNLTKKWEKV